MLRNNLQWGRPYNAGIEGQGRIDLRLGNWPVVRVARGLEEKGKVMSKKVLSVMMAAVLAVSLMPAPAFASTQDIAAGSSQSLSVQALTKGKSKAKLNKATNKMRACYKKVLKQGQNGTGKFKSAYSKSGSMKKYWGAYYSMYDVDKNGTPELFVHAGSYNLNTEWYAYTMKSGKAKFLGKFGTGQMTLGAGKGHKLYGTHVHMNAYAVAQVKLKSGKIKSTWKYEGYATREGLKAAEKFVKKKGIKPLAYIQATNLATLNSAKVTK